MENWKNLMHLFVTIFLSNFATYLVNPTIADVTMDAVCSGQDECSLSIYLSGFQQAIAGLGSVIAMPLLGNLSDTYGRKLLLTIPLTLAIIPFVILAVNRTSTEFFYVYYVVKTLTSIVTNGGSVCLAISYLADNVTEGERVSAFGIYSGVVSAAIVCGTFAARILPIDHIFRLAAVTAAVAAVYMRVFLEDDRRSGGGGENETAMLIKETEDEDEESSRDLFKLPKDMIRLFKSSTTVSLASFVAFFNSLAEAGVSAFLMYFLKVRFHFGKDEFADIWLIVYVTSTFSNMILMPIVGPILGEETLLCIGLFFGFLNLLIDSIAWAPWVPYASSLLGVFFSLASPSIRCIISKRVGPHQQGIAQGCLMGIASFSNVVSPLIFSPLSAIFLSEDAPFYFPGFSILSVGHAFFVGFLLSTVIKIQPILSRNRATNHPCALA